MMEQLPTWATVDKEFKGLGATISKVELFPVCSMSLEFKDEPPHYQEQELDEAAENFLRHFNEPFKQNSFIETLVECYKGKLGALHYCLSLRRYYVHLRDELTEDDWIKRRWPLPAELTCNP